MKRSNHRQLIFVLNILSISVCLSFIFSFACLSSENSCYFEPELKRITFSNISDSYLNKEYHFSLDEPVVSDFAQKENFNVEQKYGNLTKANISGVEIESDDLTETSFSDEVDYNGNSISFSKEAVIRGSLSLPSLKKIQIWGNGYLGSGHITPQENGRIKNNLSGAMIGLTLSCGSYGKISGYYNFNEGKLGFSDFKTKAETNLAGLSYTMDVGSAYFMLLGTYGSDSYQMNLLNRDLLLDYEGYQATGYMESGLVMQTAGLFALNPFGSLQYSYLEHDSIDRLSISIREGDRTNYDAFYSTMGSRITVNLAGMNAFTLQGRMAWIHQLRSQNESIQNISFGRVPGSILPSQVFYEGNAGRDYFWGGAGMRVGLWNFLALSLDYDVLVNSYQTTHLGSAGLLISF